MRRCPSPLEQSRNTQNERAGADGGDVLCTIRLPEDELHGLSISDRPNDTAHAAWNANQIKRRTVRESVRRHEAESTIARHGRLRFGDDVGCRLRQPGEDLQWACEIELRQFGENDEADIEALTCLSSIGLETRDQNVGRLVASNAPPAVGEDLPPAQNANGAPQSGWPKWVFFHERVDDVWAFCFDDP